MTPIVVRRAAIADAAGIRRVHAASVEQLCGRDYPRREIGKWIRGMKLANYRSSLRDRMRRTWVACAGKRIVGFASLLGTEVYGLYVHPRWARRGVGSRLYGSVERAARRRRVVKIVLTSTLTAVAFYRAMGFRGGRSYVYRLSSGARVRVINMRKPLPRLSARESARRLAALGGTMPNFKIPPRRRPD